MVSSLSTFAITLISIATVTSITNFNLPKDKHTHLHFYLHDTLTARNPTAIKVAPPPAGKPANVFGEVSVIDDPLTETPDISSKLIGRAQGIYAQSSKQPPALLMALNLAFITGEFNGSSLAVIGRNPYLENVRELPVVGGSAAFRFARGYALAKTYSFNTSSSNAVVEYNVYVMHY